MVDAVHIPDVDIKQVGIVKGDAKSVSIAAASILAKVTRDRFMVEMDKLYPEYGLQVTRDMVQNPILKQLKNMVRRLFIVRHLSKIL